ncbi:MAG: caspase family protein, partial [Planctomycetota bacterium]
METSKEWRDRAIDCMSSRFLLTLSMVVFAWASVLLGLSFVLGLDSVTDPVTGREVGFAHSPNWTAGFLFFLPLATAALAWLVHALPRLFAGLQERSMIAGDARATWRAVLRVCFPWLLAFVLASGAMSVYECWRECYRPLFELGSLESLATWNETHPDEQLPVNWTKAALAPAPETVSPTVNLVFGALAWGLQFLAKVIFGLFLLHALALTLWLARHGLGFFEPRLVPDLGDPDPRCGFQRFELPMTLLMAIATIFVPMLWLIVVQNLYNVSAMTVDSPWDLVFHYGSTPIASLFETGGATDYNVYWPRRIGVVSIMLGGVLAAAVMLPIVVRSARGYGEERIGSLGANEFERQFGVAPAVARARLAAMPAWPFRFIGTLELCCLALLGMASLWFFRLAPYTMLGLIAVLTLRARRTLRIRGEYGGAYRKLVHAALILTALGGAGLFGKAFAANSGSRGMIPVDDERVTAYVADYTASHALLIGIDYEGSSWLSRLKNAKRDVAAIETALNAMSRKWEIQTLTGDKATRRGILDALGELRKAAKENDRVFIFYAGHGGSRGERSGYILPSDAERATEDVGGASWIRFHELTGFLSDVRAKHVLLALDCCYSGRATRAGTRDSEPDETATVQRLLRKHSTQVAHVVIASGRPNQLVADGDEHSPFAAAFLAALQSPRPALTTSVLFGKIEEEFLGQQTDQDPQIDYVAQDGEFLF